MKTQTYKGIPTMSGLQIREYIHINAKNFEGFFQIRSWERLYYIANSYTTPEFSSVAGNASSGFKSFKESLQPPKSPARLYFVVPAIWDRFQYRIELQSGRTKRGGIHSVQGGGYFDNQICPYPVDTEKNFRFAFWLVEDHYPSIDARNKSPSAAIPIPIFEGDQFDIRKVPAGEEPDKYTSVDIPTGVRDKGE